MYTITILDLSLGEKIELSSSLNACYYASHAPIDDTLTEEEIILGVNYYIKQEIIKEPKLKYYNVAITRHDMKTYKVEFTLLPYSLPVYVDILEIKGGPDYND